MKPYRLTDPIPGEPWRTRQSRERAERARILTKPRRPHKVPMPKGWELPF
jgi:hypothetical protein